MCRCSPASTFGAPPLTPSAGFVLGPGEELEGGRVGTVPGGARPLPTCWRVGGSCGALALCGRAAGWLAQAVCPEPASARLSPSGMAHVLFVCGQAPVCSGEPCSGPRSLPGTASGNPAAGRHMRCRNPQVRQGGPGAGAQPAGDPPPPRLASCWSSLSRSLGSLHVNWPRLCSQSLSPQRLPCPRVQFFCLFVLL